MEQRTRGRTGPHYYSNRLKHKLGYSALFTCTIVEAPAGYGKTTAIRDFVKARLPRGTPVYWFTATNEQPAAGLSALVPRN